MNFNPIDFSKYAELRDLWNMHPSNTEGALYKGYRPAEGETAQVLRRYGELTQQLSDEVGGGDLYTEAMIALGGTGGIGNGLTGENLGDPNYYKNMMARRQAFLDSGRSVQDADANEVYRFASVMTGQRPADLNYVQAEAARNYASQYGTPNQIDYTNQLATQLRSAQPQAPISQPLVSQPYTATANYLPPSMPSIQSQNMMPQPSLFQPNMLAGQYMPQNTQAQYMMPQPSFGFSNALGGQYSQPNFQNQGTSLQNTNPNRQLSQLNLGQTQRNASLKFL